MAPSGIEPASHQFVAQCLNRIPRMVRKRYFLYSHDWLITKSLLRKPRFIRCNVNGHFWIPLILWTHLKRLMGRDSSVGIATRYGLDGPRTESRCLSRFSAPVQICPGANPASYTMGNGSLPVVKRPGHGVDHPPPSSAEVKERVEIYLYSPSGHSWPVLG